jgi:hypothetical protein
MKKFSISRGVNVIFHENGNTADIGNNTECFKKTFALLKAYMNLFRRYTQCSVSTAIASVMSRGQLPNEEIQHQPWSKCNISRKWKYCRHWK